MDELPISLLINNSLGLCDGRRLTVVVTLTDMINAGPFSFFHLQIKERIDKQDSKPPSPIIMME
jgi:hypothetical protein